MVKQKILDKQAQQEFPGFSSGFQSYNCDQHLNYIALSKDLLPTFMLWFSFAF